MEPVAVEVVATDQWNIPPCLNWMAQSTQNIISNVRSNEWCDDNSNWWCQIICQREAPGHVVTIRRRLSKFIEGSTASAFCLVWLVMSENTSSQSQNLVLALVALSNPSSMWSKLEHLWDSVSWASMQNVGNSNKITKRAASSRNKLNKLAIQKPCNQQLQRRTNTRHN